MVTYPTGMRVEIGLTDSELSALSIHLNTALDYARIVITSAKFFLNNANRRPPRLKKFTGRFIIKQSTKSQSRVFIFHQKHKFISFTFPFRISNLNIPCLDCEGWNMDSLKLDILLSIIEELSDNGGSRKKGIYSLPLTLADVAEKLINTSTPPLIVTMNEISILSLILTNEPGYIRYDYDPNNANGHIHPKHHLDINYSIKGTYKYGLYGNMEADKFESIFDKDIEKQYLHPYHSMLEPVKIGSTSNKIKLRMKVKKKQHGNKKK